MDLGLPSPASFWLGKSLGPCPFWQRQCVALDRDFSVEKAQAEHQVGLGSWE